MYQESEDKALQHLQSLLRGVERPQLEIRQVHRTEQPPLIDRLHRVLHPASLLDDSLTIYRFIITTA